MLDILGLLLAWVGLSYGIGWLFIRRARRLGRVGARHGR